VLTRLRLSLVVVAAAIVMSGAALSLSGLLTAEERTAPTLSNSLPVAVTAADLERVHAIPGKIMLAGGTFIDPMGEEFVRLAGGTSARIIIIPTAYGPTEEEGTQQFIDQWNQWKPAVVEVMHTRDRNVANQESFVSPLKKATGVWFTGGKQSRLLEVYSGTLVEKELHAMLQRGAAVGGNCAGAMAMGEQVIVRNGDDFTTRTGFNLLPKLIVDSHFLERNRIERLRGFLDDRPGHFGLGIDSATAVVLEKGQLRVMGKSYAVTMINGPRLKVESWASGDEVEVRSLVTK
jgi:cyanophycinase